MVDFALTEEQLNLREMAHAFAERGTRRSPGTTIATGP